MRGASAAARRGGAGAAAGRQGPEAVVFDGEMGTLLALLAFLIYLFVFNVVRVDVAALIVLVLLGLSGLVPPAELFDGFSSNAVISIIAIMIIGAGLEKTGIMGQVAGYILRLGGSTERRVLPILSAAVSLVSSFMVNVGAAALFLPVVSRISTRTGIPLARLLMPMAFCAILGGTVTMVGSSPLIILNDLIQSSNRHLPSGVHPMATFHLFDVTPIGIALVLAGIAYFALAGRFVLPRVRGPSADPGKTSRYFERVYGITGGIFEAKVTLDSPLAGRTIGEIEESGEQLPFILGIRNADQIRLAPPRDEMIWVGTVFALMGAPEEIRAFTRRQKLVLSRDLKAFVEHLSPSRAGVSEVVIPPGANIIGETIGDLHMRKRYGVSVLAVHRGEETLSEDVRSIRLRAGDTLVLHSTWEDLHMLARDKNFVVVTDYPHELVRTHKVLHAMVFFGLALGLTLFTDMRLSMALMVGAAGMVASGVLTMDEAYRAISWQTVFLLASLIPFGLAMETTGTAYWIAQQTMGLMTGVPVWGLQAGLALLATFLTLVISNVGATVLLVPFAVNIAVHAGANPAVFALTVALATSNSFLIPTNQVNALVMGPAGYRVGDFLRAGSAMTLLFLATMLVMINLVF